MLFFAQVDVLAAGRTMETRTKAQTMPQTKKNELLKQAADAIDGARRREEATKLAFTMVEHGKVAPFESHAALEEKVASLMTKDLEVVKEALSMDVDLPNFGKVANDSPTAGDPTATFFHSLAEE